MENVDALVFIDGFLEPQSCSVSFTEKVDLIGLVLEIKHEIKKENETAKFHLPLQTTYMSAIQIYFQLGSGVLTNK